MPASPYPTTTAAEPPSIVRPALVLFVLLTVITGVLYPLAVTGVARGLFPGKAAGSILMKDGRPVGSSLIGQEFSAGPDSGRYFWGRLSATGPVPYSPFNADKSTGSGGSNLAPTSPDLLKNAQARIDALRAADAAAGYGRPAGQAIPVDLVTASASGLDPHLSAAGVEYQVARVARARGLDEGRVRAAVLEHTEGRAFGVLGEPVVNVLELNLALDAPRR